MKSHPVLGVLLLLGISIVAVPSAAGQEGDAGERSEPRAVPAALPNPDAPPETRLLGQLVGTWDARQVNRSRDGTWPTETTRAEWRWRFILDGHAIQDDWIALEAEDGTSRGRRVVGTNIRIYNADEEQWHMAWIDTNNRRLATFTATNEDGKVIMTGHNAQGRRVRNTFSNLTGRSFDWVQEWTADDGKTWFAVSKIHCLRKEDGNDPETGASP